MTYRLRLLFLFFIAASLLLPSGCNNTPETPAFNNRAAIIDQLYLMQPNPALIQQTSDLLASAGFEVDVWQGSDITVDFYRRLPALGYRLILLRVHSGTLLEMRGDEVVELGKTYLFTAENYTANRHVTDQLADKVSYALMEEEQPLVFAVNSDFIRSAKGTFEGSVILAMGCESYRYDDLPIAFIQKGASVYIGWSDIVSLEHMDQVIRELVKNICADNMTISQGIAQTINDIGHDPYFDSFLKLYPEAGGNQKIKDLTD